MIATVIEVEPPMLSPYLEDETRELLARLKCVGVVEVSHDRGGADAVHGVAPLSSGTHPAR